MSCRYCLQFALLGIALLLIATPAFSQSDRIDLAPESEQEVEMVQEKFPEYARFILPELSEDPPSANDRRTLYVNGLRGFDVASVQVWLTSELIEQVWDPETGDWVNEARVMYSRDASGSIMEQLFQEWDVDAAEWVNSLRISYSESQTLYEEWDLEANAGAGDWVPVQRFTSTFTSQGNLETSTQEIWDEESGSYFIFSRSTYTYDASGELVIQRLAESGLFGPLQPSARYTYAYDDDGNEIEEIVEFYNNLGEWENNRREQREYDEFGEEIEELIQHWDMTANAGAGDWVNSSLTITEFTPDSQDPTEVVETDQSWDAAANAGAGAWINDERFISAYDASTDTFVETDEMWDAAAEEWVAVDRYTYFYSEEGVLDEFLYEEWDSEGDAWVNSERGEAEFNEEGLTVVQLTQVWENEAWVNARRTLISYEEFDATAAENETPGRGFELGSNYPNPFSEATTIYFTVAAPEHVTLEIFDMLGRRVTTLVDSVKPSGKHQVVLDASGLAGGLYIYRLTSDQRTESRTMLLVR